MSGRDRRLRFHPVADIFPLLDGDEFDALVTDVRENGVLEPIRLYEGQVLDGRNRYRAAQAAGVDCPTKAYDGADPVSFVVSLNLKRRHLNKSQLAYVALDIERIEAEQAKARQIRKPNSVPQLVAEQKGEAREKAAAAVGTNRQYVSDAKAIAEKAPELAAQIKAGTKTVTQAKREIKEQAREQRRAENRIKVAAIPEPRQVVGSARFATIAIDPPWDWGDEGDQDQLGRARPTYETWSVGRLMELPVGDFADDDCHLYLWITNRSLPKGFDLIERWGFRYITALTWVKPHFGMGNYFRGQTEHVLFGVKGSQPLKRKDVGTAFHWPRGPQGHSSKPMEFYQMVESCSPGPYLEMFSRCDRADWFAWGENASAAA